MEKKIEKIDICLRCNHFRNGETYIKDTEKGEKIYCCISNTEIGVPLSKCSKIDLKTN